MAEENVVIPLTTTFTPAPSCLTSTYTVPPNGRDSLTIAYDNYAVIRGLDPVCYPGDFYLIRTTVSGGQSVAQYYSPGFCPASYTTATIGIGSGNDKVTSVTCCPSGMFIGGQIGGVTGSLQTYCTGGFYTAEDGGPGTTAIDVVNGSTTATFGIYVSYAVPVIVQYQSSDVSLWSSASATPTSSIGSSTTTAATTSEPTSTAIPATSSPKHESSGLSSGATIGLGVGLGVGILIIIITAAIFFWMRRSESFKRNSPGPNVEVDIGKSIGWQDVSNSLIKKEGYDQGQLHEISGNQPSAAKELHEVSGFQPYKARIPAELEGHYRG